MTARYKPGSRVQQVWEAFEQGGAEAATRLGASLNLAPSTLVSWNRMWAKENGVVPPPKVKVAKDHNNDPEPLKPVKVPQSPKPPKLGPTGQPKLRLTKAQREEAKLLAATPNCRLTWSKRPVRMLRRGDQQCIVTFLDTNTEECVLTSEVVDFPKS